MALSAHQLSACLELPNRSIYDTQLREHKMATHVIRMTDLPKDPDSYLRYCRNLELCIALDTVIRYLVILEPRKDDIKGRNSLPAFMDDPKFPKFPVALARDMIGGQQAFQAKLRKHIEDAHKYFDTVEAKQLAERAGRLTLKRLAFEVMEREQRSTFDDDEELMSERIVQQMETRFG